jgi:hypothetical protein
MPAPTRELRGVVEQVADDLRDPRGVGVDPQWLPHDTQVERDTPGREERPVILDGIPGEGGELDSCAVQLDHPSEMRVTSSKSSTSRVS